MFRPMTSDVSALSGVVAKGHQALHFVSSTPLKFRTAGFPQYCSIRFMLRPGDVACPALARTFTTELSRVGSPLPTSVITEVPC